MYILKRYNYNQWGDPSWKFIVWLQAPHKNIWKCTSERYTMPFDWIRPQKWRKNWMKCFLERNVGRHTASDGLNIEWTVTRMYEEITNGQNPDWITGNMSHCFESYWGKCRQCIPPVKISTGSFVRICTCIKFFCGKLDMCACVVDMWLVCIRIE